MTTDTSEQRLVHLICGAMTVGRVSLLAGVSRAVS